MKLTKRTKFAAGAAAVTAAIALSAGSAFTGGGLAESLDDTTDGFVGGGIAQTIVGAEVESLVYSYDANTTHITMVTVTIDTTATAEGVYIEFTNTDGLVPTITWTCTDTTANSGVADDDVYECVPASGTQPVEVDSIYVEVY